MKAAAKGTAIQSVALPDIAQDMIVVRAAARQAQIANMYNALPKTQGLVQAAAQQLPGRPGLTTLQLRAQQNQKQPQEVFLTVSLGGTSLPLCRV